jgi:hypothetical protein
LTDKAAQAARPTKPSSYAVSGAAAKISAQPISIQEVTCATVSAINGIGPNLALHSDTPNGRGTRPLDERLNSLFEISPIEDPILDFWNAAHSRAFAALNELQRRCPASLLRV